MLADFIARFNAAYLVDKAGASQQVDFRDHLGNSLLTGETTPVLVAPTVTTQPSITGGASTGSVLTLSEGAASGTPAPTGTIQWLRGTTAISGATGSTYTLVSADEGKAISARVTWTNSAGSVVATSNAITGQAPAPTATAPAQVTGLTYAAPELTWAAPANGGSAITRYDVEIVAAAAAFTGTPTATSATAALDVSAQPSGDWKAQVRAVNAVGNGPWSDPAPFSIDTAATVYDGSLSLAYWRAGDPGVTEAAITGTEVSATGQKVTSLAPSGTGGLTLVEGGTGSVNVVVRDPATGALQFGNNGATGRYLTATGLSIPVNGGAAIVVDVEQGGTLTGTRQAVQFAGMTARTVSAAAHVNYGAAVTGSTSVVKGAGTVTAGSRGVFYGEFDADADQITFRNIVTGQVVTEALTIATVANATSLTLGQGFLGGLIHGFEVVGWAAGAARPRSRAEMLADFRLGA